MTSPAADIPENEVPSETECKICHQLLKRPKQLACMHSFCLECLEDLAGEANTIECPTCQQVTNLAPVGGSVANLPANSLLSWMADRLRAKHVEQAGVAENKSPTLHFDMCGHSWAENRLLCEHCQGRFCDDCQVRHKERLKIEIFEMSAQFESRRAKIDEERLAAELQRLRERFDDDIAKCRQTTLQAAETAIKALQTQAEQTANEATQKTNAEQAKIAALIHHAKTSGDTLRHIVNDVKNTSVLHLSLSDVADVHRAIVECVDAVEAMENPLGKAAQFNTEVPRPEFDIALKYFESGAFLGVITATSSTQLRPSTSSGASGSTAAHRQDNNHAERPHPYSKMEMIAAISGKDCIGNDIRRPSLAVTIPDERRDTAAVCHNQNRISILTVDGRLTATFQLYDPDDLNTDVAFVDMAADANRIFVTDLSHRILALDLRFTPMPPGGAVIPAIFARTQTQDPSCGFRGLAISFHREELFTYDNGDLVAFSLIDGSVRYRLQDPSNWRRRILSVRECHWPLVTPPQQTSPMTTPPQLGSPEQPLVVFSSDSGQSLWTKPMFSNSSIFNIAEPGISLRKVNGIQPGGIDFDIAGNLFIADNCNERIQVLSNSMQQVGCFKASVCSHLFDPTSVACLEKPLSSCESSEIDAFSGEENEHSMAVASNRKQHHEAVPQTPPLCGGCGPLGDIQGDEELKLTVLVVTDCLPGRILLFTPKLDQKSILTTTKPCEQPG